MSKICYVNYTNKLDKCISKEINELNKKGIKTLASCCGHEKGLCGMIVVIDEDIPKMLKLGYIQGGTYQSEDLELNKIYIPFSSKSICKCK